MIRQEEVYKIGKIGKPHGVKGELTLFFDDDVFDRVEAEYLVLCVDGILVPFYMDDWRFKTGETALVKFTDIDTKEAASELTGCEVFFPKHLSDREEDDLTWDEIKGFEVVDANHGNIGNVVSIDESTVNVIMEVETAKGNIILVPANENLIKEVDLENRRIVVDLPDGLVDLNDID
ncbi:MAG TPA: 16S rRNA processing protein RimM [Prevotella sp.]|nr:16S rRNA processing protein RimM [Prevotella sp.]